MPHALLRSSLTNARPVVLRPSHIGHNVHNGLKVSSSKHIVHSSGNEGAAHTVGSVVNATSTEELLVAARHVFHETERDIEEYLKTENDPVRADQCLKILEALQRSYLEASSGCELDDRNKEGSSAACQQLNNLKQLLHELSYSGVDALLAVLAVQLGVEREHDKIMAEMTAPDSDLEADAASSFDAADSSHRGSLDKEQLLRALADIGFPITHPEVNKALAALDAHGYVTFDTFLALVKTQAMRSRDLCDGDESSTSFFSGLPHARPSWWSEAPKALDNML